MKIDFEKVLKEYGLKEGDWVEIKKMCLNPHKIIYSSLDQEWYLQNNEGTYIIIDIFINGEWEKVKGKKKAGDLICTEEIKCKKCPLKSITCFNFLKGETCRQLWENSLKRFPELEHMRGWIEKELDKEVEE